MGSLNHTTGRKTYSEGFHWTCAPWFRADAAVPGSHVDRGVGLTVLPPSGLGEKRAAGRHDGKGNNSAFI